MSGPDKSPDLAAEVAALRVEVAELRARIEVLADWLADVAAGRS